jgi:hypothetical protein
LRAQAHYQLHLDVSPSSAAPACAEAFLVEFERGRLRIVSAPSVRVASADICPKPQSLAAASPLALWLFY